MLAPKDDRAVPQRSSLCVQPLTASPNVILERCLEAACNSRSKTPFGALVLGRRGDVLGVGWNRRSTCDDAKFFKSGYATHAEMAALSAVDRAGRIGEAVAVFVTAVDKRREKIGLRDSAFFTCSSCAPRLMSRSLPVFVPTLDGWQPVLPEAALEQAKPLKGSNFWKRAHRGESLGLLNITWSKPAELPQDWGWRTRRKAFPDHLWRSFGLPPPMTRGGVQFFHHRDLDDNQVALLLKTGLVVAAGHGPSRIFGTLVCVSGKTRMARNNRLLFLSWQDPLSLKFRPCGKCLPEDYRAWRT